jgi:hypothetical protein
MLCIKQTSLTEVIQKRNESHQQVKVRADAMGSSVKDVPSELRGPAMHRVLGQIIFLKVPKNLFRNLPYPSPSLKADCGLAHFQPSTTADHFLSPALTLFYPLSPHVHMSTLSWKNTHLSCDPILQFFSTFCYRTCPLSQHSHKRL